MQIINQHNILVNKTLIDLNGSMRHNLTFVNNKCDVLLLMHRVKVGEPFFLLLFMQIIQPESMSHMISRPLTYLVKGHRVRKWCNNRFSKLRRILV